MKFMKTGIIIKEIQDELSFHDDLTDKVEFLSDLIDNIVNIRKDTILNYGERKMNIRNLNNRNGVITKSQIKSLFDFCRGEGTFEAKDLEPAGLDDDDFRILEVLNKVKMEYNTKADIVDESFLILNGKQ